MTDHKKPPRNEVAVGSALPEPTALRGHKSVFFRSESSFVSTAVYTRSKLKRGNEIKGPALIEEHASTTVVQPGDYLIVDMYGNLQLSIGSERS